MSQNFSLNLDSDIPKYKKKKNNSSKSNKRSDHKHKYTTIIMRGFVGWIWGKECEICGRVKSNHFMDRDFIKPECKDDSCTGEEKYYSSISEKNYYSYEELRKIYPNIKIIEKAPWELI